jgi:hypothetical protein
MKRWQEPPNMHSQAEPGNEFRFLGISPVFSYEEPFFKALKLYLYSDGSLAAKSVSFRKKWVYTKKHARSQALPGNAYLAAPAACAYEEVAGAT